jgi:23S rRNA maturation mini-RNase III
MSSGRAYQPNELVLAYHGPSIYEAKVLRTQPDLDGTHKYFIHYM